MKPHLALLGILASGCMATITYEPRTLPTPSRSRAEACYQERRIEIATADAQWSYSSGGTYNPVWGTMTTTVTTSNDRGLAFYQGGERIELADALRRTGDLELVRAHERHLASSRGSATGFKLARNAFIALTAGGLAMVGVATAQVVGDDNLAEKGLGDFPLLWIGTGTVLAAIIPAIVVSKTYRGAVDHSIDTRIVRSHLADRTFEAVRTYNRTAMAACGYSGDDDLPLSPRLRR